LSDCDLRLGIARRLIGVHELLNGGDELLESDG
jgi:hypothetical protein